MRILRAVLLFTLATAAFADIITLRNGRVINGVYLGGTASQMQVQVGDNVETVNVADVSRIEFRGSEPVARDTSRPSLRRNPNIMMPGDDAGPTLSRPTSSASNSDDSGRPTLSRPTSTASNSDDSGRPTLRRAPSAGPDPAQPVQAAAPSADANAPAPPIEVPANTSFVVRTMDAIDSDTAKPGQTFLGTLDAPVMVNGSEIVPRGADVTLKIIDDKDGGRVTGKASLTVSLWQVKVRGKMVDVNTQNVSRESASKTGKTAKAAGVGAALGAIVCAAAGGGKGAAIGAGAGAGAGTAASAMTRGEHVRIPAESVLTFFLDSPVTF